MPNDALAAGNLAFNPLYKEVKLRLTRGLAAGEWKPGEAIPSEARLAERFNVSIGTIRKAIDELVAERILVRQQGRGTFVASHTEGDHMIHILVHDKKDTVGVAVIEGIKAGQELTGWVMEDDSTIKVKALNDVPIGHKVATKEIKKGDTIIKYGFDIGKAVADIRLGEHAHVHNIKTKRW